MNTRFMAGSRRPPQDREYATLVDAGELVLLRTIDQTACATCAMSSRARRSSN